jgi:hypothetical protein
MREEDQGREVNHRQGTQIEDKYNWQDAEVEGRSETGA